MPPRERSVIRLPSFEAVKSDPVLYAHASRVLHLETSPMASATAMYHSGRNPLRKIHRVVESDDENVDVVRGEKRRRLHKAFLRYHDPNNWPLLREALKAMGRADLIGNGKHHLIPTYQPLTGGCFESARKKNSTGLTIPTMVTEKTTPAPSKARTASPASNTRPASGTQSAEARPARPRPGTVLTQHTGLPPRETGAKRGQGKPVRKGRGD